MRRRSGEVDRGPRPAALAGTVPRSEWSDPSQYLNRCHHGESESVRVEWRSVSMGFCASATLPPGDDRGNVEDPEIITR